MPQNLNDADVEVETAVKLRKGNSLATSASQLRAAQDVRLS